MSRLSRPNTEQNTRHMAMGSWKTNTFPFHWDAKAQKGRFRQPSRTRPPGYVKMYMPNVPVGGWPGGEPEKNGWKPSGGKR